MRCDFDLQKPLSHLRCFYSLLVSKFLDTLLLQTFADNKINVAKLMVPVISKQEDNVGIGQK